ncbi:D-arginine dehydrogenase [Altererythrobacter atlanticus]|uniref:Hydrogen cyanide synthase subunit HcnC n=1 Tax=Croceibacterium atlanticum TaxID=1267766 RepID=A0A0F7KPL8_9SPHN|nr:FAD-dependent oxidoreductase [Croceibacterium atlanticum]AKH42443.1 Hydrogen cyanide synthase subunit HcnC precursor [Croceibacterium atlanticum]MBB5731220.1 D-arginine dehydrogenase [Croceibacterium atlanticum]
MSAQYDIAIIGAGMAGASIAAELAPHASVLLLEAEAQPGYHTTGRSAAFWEECYGGPELVPLTLASGHYLRQHGFLTPRGALYIARSGQEDAVESFMARFADSGATIERLGRAEMERRIPGLLPDWTLAISEPACADIDVAALHQHYLAAVARLGVHLRTNSRLETAEREGNGWRLGLARGEEARAAMLVDAAGAWADPVAELAGAKPLSITPLRRTVAQLRTDPAPPEDLPLVLDLCGEFYFKPENGKLWLSPHDETPSAPCDAAPEELDVAIAIDRFEQVANWKVQALERKWAGLRSFSPDRLPVYGFDPRQEGFFWFAGQGGFGIQTAPAAARLAAQMLIGLPRDEMTEGLDADVYSPARFG